MEELCSSYLVINIDILKNKYVEFHRLSFWHDVGVTALSALATALLTINKESGGYEFITLVVPFLTGLITVFVACDHFFKFRSKADQLAEALCQLVHLQSEMAECECNNGVSTKNRSKVEIYTKATEIMSKIKVFPGLDDSVMGLCRKNAITNNHQ